MINNTPSNKQISSEVQIKHVENVLSSMLEYGNSVNDKKLDRLCRQLQLSIEDYLTANNTEYNELATLTEDTECQLNEKQKLLVKMQSIIADKDRKLVDLKNENKSQISQIQQAEIQSNKIEKKCKIYKKNMEELKANQKSLEIEIALYQPIKALGGANAVIKKLKKQKAALYDAKKQVKNQTKALKTKSKPAAPIAKSLSGLSGKNKPTYKQIENAYYEMEALFRSAEAKLIDAQLVMARDENIVGMFSYKNDFLFTFPSLLVIGTNKNEKGEFQKKQLHRSLLYLSNQGVGGLLYLDDDENVQMMRDNETNCVKPKNEISMILAKAWLKKLKFQEGKLKKEDLDLADFLQNNQKMLPKLLSKEEIKALPMLVRGNKSDSSKIMARTAA